jgi:uncharacterized protein (TIGR00369 family)
MELDTKKFMHMGDGMEKKNEFGVEQLLEIWRNGNQEERDILRRTVEAIESRRQYQHPYLRTHFEFHGVFYPPDRYELKATITPYMLNIANYVHGGITAYIADSAMGTLVNALLPPDCGAVTSDLNIHYLAPGQGQHLVADAVLLHMGKRTAVTECKVRNDAGKLIAMVTASFAIIRPKKANQPIGDEIC